jgi:hypothetical protein
MEGSGTESVQIIMDPGSMRSKNILTDPDPAPDQAPEHWSHISKYSYTPSSLQLTHKHSDNFGNYIKGFGSFSMRQEKNKDELSSKNYAFH